MKKLNNKYKIAILSIVLSFTACTDLEETVYSNVTAEGTVLTASDIGNIMAPSYAAFRNIYWDWDGQFDINEESSDCIVTPFRNGIGWGDYYITMHKHTFGPTVSHAEAGWYYGYQAIFKVNKAIYQIENLKGLENANVYINELRALRAIYYYILYDNFRNLPIETNFINPDGYLPTQSTSQEVYNFIEKELKEAMPTLKDGNTNAEYGRVTKWAAKMTLAKLYLNAGVYIGTPKWAEALSQVNEVINSGKYSLAPNYLDSYLIKNEGSPEEILSIPFDEKYTGGSYYPFKTLYPASRATFGMQDSPWGGSGAIPQFIDTYDVDDSRLKDCWLGGLQKTKTGAPLLLEDGTQLNYVNYLSTVDGCEFNEGYRLVKYEIGSGTSVNSTNDVPFFRFGDALMIKAECLLRTGDAAGAASIVSQVRARNFKSNPAKAVVTAAKLMGGSVYKYGEYSNGTITKFEGGADIQYGGFLDELGWEFVGEHHRKQDLIRFGVYTKKSWFSHKPNGDYRVIFPIPQSQMDANHNLKQNPGYN